MPCDTRPNLDALQRAKMNEALKRLQAAIGAGSVGIVLSRTGAIALRNWAPEQRAGLTDLCAVRKLRNSPEFRRALARAEALAGVKLNESAIRAGVHSHDGGQTWGAH